MNELDKLRPEVRKALAWLKSGARPGTRSFDGWSVIHAELLRLADELAALKNENAQLRDVLADRDMDREMAAHANKELAALKARIAEAIRAVPAGSFDGIVILPVRGESFPLSLGAAKRLALLPVEE